MFEKPMQFLFVILIIGITASCATNGANKIPSSQRLQRQDIHVSEGTRQTRVEILGDRPILYTAFRVSNPERLIIEMAGVTLPSLHDGMRMSRGPVHAIKSVKSRELDIARLEFELDKQVKTMVRPEGSKIIVEMNRSGKNFEQQGQVQLKPKPIPRKKVATLLPPAIGGRLPEIPVPLPLPILVEKIEISPVSVKTGSQKVVAFKKKSGKNKSETTNHDVKKTSFPPQKRPPPPALKKAVQSLHPAKKVTDIRLIQGKVLRMLIISDGTLSPEILFVDKKKDRLLIDLPGVKKTMKKNRIPGDGTLVKRIRFGQHANKLRLVIDLLAPIAYFSELNKKTMTISLLPSK